MFGHSLCGDLYILAGLQDGVNSYADVQELNVSLLHMETFEPSLGIFVANQTKAEMVEFIKEYAMVK